MRNQYFLLLSLFFSFFILESIEGQTSLIDLIESKRPDLEQVPELNPLIPEIDIPVNLDLEDITEFGLYRMDGNVLNDVRQSNRGVIKLNIRLNNRPLLFELVESDLFRENSRITRGSDGSSVNYNPGDHYWGIVKGRQNSVVALSIFEDRIEGSVSMDGKTYNIGKVTGREYHILYRSDDVPFDQPECGVESIVQDFEDSSGSGAEPDMSGTTVGSVGVYYEVDHDIFLSKNSSIQESVNFITAILNEVALIYAAESINLYISEIKVWDVPDPYDNLANSSSRLVAFRDALGGNYPGDLAHLLSFDGGGGIAYVNVLCNSFYGIAYSGIYSSYAAYPAYSWTVMVIAHELGHNFGSRHTHACVWNGNNTPIDGCGPQAGYPDSGCSITGPIPASGTVMSYCHLISGVGIDLGLGFGQQPGDLIRSRTINATCLNNCIEGASCNDGDSCTTNDVYDANCNCSGTPLPDSDGDGVCDVLDICAGGDDNIDSDQDGIPDFCDSCDNRLTGTSCDDGDSCTTNDVYDANCNCSGTVQDSDLDGVCDGIDQCPGGDDTIDNNNNGQPDACEETCVIQSTTFPTDPLTHSGSGVSSTELTLSEGTRDISFTISGMGARTNGRGSNRYIDLVEVKYTDGIGNIFDYGQFSGATVSSASITISGIIQSVEVLLSDGYDGNSGTNMSISLGEVSVCAPPCADGDIDGVCDINDVCPGYDDTIDSDNDGIPDGCDDCESVISEFTTNPLTHSGNGSSSTSLSLNNQTDISFTISQLGARTGGKPSNRYSELVVIEYKSSANAAYSLYGSFSGTNQNTVDVDIPGAVAEVRVTLSNELGGNTGLSVSFSSVSGCLGVQALQSSNRNSPKSLVGPTIEAFPNPFEENIYLELSNVVPNDPGNIRIMDNQGRLIYEMETRGTDSSKQLINTAEWARGVYFIQYSDSKTQKTKKVVKIN